MNSNISLSIKIILSALFLLCLADLPYGYFQFVRFAGVIGFGILAYEANEKGQKTFIIIYVCLAVLFQPFVKISLGRELWNIVDVIVSIFLIFTLLISKKLK